MAVNKQRKSMTDSKREVTEFETAEVERLKKFPSKLLLLVEDGLVEDPEYPAEFFCVLFNVTRRVWDGICQKGFITRSSPGKHELLGTIKAYRDYLGKAGTRKISSYTDSKNQEEAKLTRAKRIKAELEIQEQAGELIPKPVFYTELSEIIKMVMQQVSSLQDVLERECDLDPISVKRVEDVVDKSRQALYDKIQMCYDENPALEEAEKNSESSSNSIDSELQAMLQ